MRLKRYPTETTSKWQWGFKLFLSDSELSAPDHTVFHMCLALGSIPRWGQGHKGLQSCPPGASVYSWFSRGGPGLLWLALDPGPGPGPCDTMFIEDIPVLVLARKDSCLKYLVKE